MKTTHCPYDEPAKEQSCKYYELGELENLGCFCKFMEGDQCYNKKRINDIELFKEDN